MEEAVSAAAAASDGVDSDAAHRADYPTWVR